MTTIYTTDALGVFTQKLDVAPFAKLPKNCTLTPPPDTTGLEVAQLVAGAWQVLPSYPLPPAPPTTVPTSVTMRQACLALENAGILDDVEALVATLPRLYQIEWQRASMVERTNQLVEVVRQQQGMTVQQIDDMFIQAATL